MSRRSMQYFNYAGYREIMQDSPRRTKHRFASAILSSETTPSFVLIFAAAMAIVFANSAWHQGYHTLLHGSLPWSPLAVLPTLHHWINDGLMAVFFFVVGLEIKREILGGELSTPAKRRLPVIAAAAGMAAPAAIFLASGGLDSALVRGWAIPAATDIAFALGLIGLLGQRVPRSLRLFLLTVAIADDLGAVLIIALVYTQSVNLVWLGLAAAALIGMLAIGRMGITRPWVFAVGAAVLWLCVLHSGVHATIAGVAAAIAVPYRLDQHGDSPLLRMEHALVPWSGLVIVPLFGFANAGVSITSLAEFSAPLPLAIGLGLFMGKQAGVMGAIALADRLGIARRPEGASWLQIWGMALLCGIGFTMSLFISALAYPASPMLVEQAKLGVLAGSLASALVGFVVLRFAGRTRQDDILPAADIGH
jgi:Na+:H+ antiporter, NhaA family